MSLGNANLTEGNSQQLKRLSNHFAVLQGKKKEIEAQLDELKKEISEVDIQLQDEMKKLDVEKFSTPRGTFYVNHSFNCSVADADLAFQFLRARGSGDLIKETVNARSLSSAMKELAGEGEISLDELEENGIKYFTKETVRIRGLKSN